MLHSWLAHFSLRRFVRFSIALILLTLLGANLLEHSLNEQLKAMRHQADTLHQAHIQLQELRYHTTQIQQFLTDVSATADRDGFNDAKEHYQLALKQLDELKTISPQYGPDADTTRAAIDTFYQVGQRMAEGYISGGRETGNALMKAPGNGFDDRAEELTKQLEKLQTKVEVDVSAVTAESEALIEKSRAILVGSSLLLILPPDSSGQADVWLRRDSAAVIPDDLGQATLIAAGWQQVVSHYDAGVTREHRH